MFKMNGKTLINFSGKQAICSIFVLCYCFVGLSTHFHSDPIWDSPTENSPFVPNACEDNEDGIIVPPIQQIGHQQQITGVSISRYIFQLSPLLPPPLHPPKNT